MKKLLCVICIFALLVVAFSGAARVSAAGDITENFTDANFKAAVYEAIGKLAPQPILSSDVAGITALDVSNRDLYNLRGLEHFVSLQELDCSNNHLYGFKGGIG